MVQLYLVGYAIHMSEQYLLDYLDYVTSENRLFMTGVQPVPTVVHKERKREELQLNPTDEKAYISYQARPLKL